MCTLEAQAPIVRYKGFDCTLWHRYDPGIAGMLGLLYRTRLGRDLSKSKPMNCNATATTFGHACCLGT